MKKMIFIWAMFIVNAVRAQEQMTVYMISPSNAVIRINGRVIKNHDKLAYHKTDEVVFPDDECYVKGYLHQAHQVVVLSKKTADLSGEKMSSKFSFLLKQFIPESSPETPATKGSITSLNDLKSYLAASERQSADNSFYVPEKFFIGESIGKKIPPGVITFDEKHFLFCRMLTDTGWYDKKLNFDGQKLLIDAGLYQIDNHQADISKIKKITVYSYRDGINQVLNDFRPVFLNQDVLDELKQLKAAVSELPAADQEKFLYGYFNHFYGYMDKEDFLEMISK